MVEEREKLVESLADEYRILQDKIDKIGAFRFTVKGWSLTLIVATLLAGGATKLTPRWVLPTLMYVFIIVFFLVEKKQTDLSRSFGQRAYQIESVVTSMLRTTRNGSLLDEFLRLRHVPRIAHLIRERAQETSVERYFDRWDLGFFRSRLWRVTKEYLGADLWFYAVQAAVVLCVILFVQLPDATKGDSPHPVQVIENRNSVNAGCAQVNQNSVHDRHGKHPKEKKPESSNCPNKP